MTNAHRQFVRAHSKSEQGIALLFVVLLTSVLLLVAIEVTNISYKEVFFSIQARDSDRAFFAADTGMECGLYLDKTGTFPTSASGTAPVPGTCEGISIGPAPTADALGGLDFYQFMIPVGSPVTSCATVTIDKNIMLGSPAASYTQVSSYGYNIPPGSGTTNSCLPPGATPGSRVVTRALQTQYVNP